MSYDTQYLALDVPRFDTINEGNPNLSNSIYWFEDLR